MTPNNNNKPDAGAKPAAEKQNSGHDPIDAIDPATADDLTLECSEKKVEATVPNPNRDGGPMGATEGDCSPDCFAAGDSTADEQLAQIRGQQMQSMNTAGWKYVAAKIRPLSKGWWTDFPVPGSNDWDHLERAIREKLKFDRLRYPHGTPLRQLFEECCNVQMGEDEPTLEQLQGIAAGITEAWAAVIDALSQD